MGHWEVILRGSPKGLAPQDDGYYNDPALKVSQAFTVPC
jgi:hypothetical protein